MMVLRFGLKRKTHVKVERTVKLQHLSDRLHAMSIHVCRLIPAVLCARHLIMQ